MEAYKDFLKEFIAFKSVSTDSSFLDGINSTVEFLVSSFKENGFEVETIDGFGNPIVLANYKAEGASETCLIYGHYDVQPAKLEEGWDSEPFDLVEKNERLYARGAVDNKGQVAVHIVTAFELIKAGKLKYNLKFMIEGNEETGSPKLEDFIKENKEKLAADFVLISDGEINGDTPIIESGFRGGINLTLTIKTASSDVHSGIYGGAIPSSAHELVKFLNTLFDSENKILIPSFYDHVDEIDSEIIENNKKLPYSHEELERITGVKKLLTEGFDIYTQTGLRPTIQVTGIESGYIGEGYKNAIPMKSSARLNFRLVKSQDPWKIAELFKSFVKENLPEYVDFDITVDDIYSGVKIDLNNNFVKRASEVLSKAFGKEVLYKFSGGGLPIVTYIDELLKMPAVLVPIGNEDCNMHGANENFDLKILYKALEFSKSFFSK